MSEGAYLTEEDFSTGDGITTFPFFEDENGHGIYGYGHWAKDAFAAAVNDYDDYCANEVDLEEDELADVYLPEDVKHGWAQIVNPDDPKDEWRFRILWTLPDDFEVLTLLTPITVIKR